MSLSSLIAVGAAVFIGQTLKIFVHKHQYRNFNLWVYLEDGGMPSCYAVALSALCTSLFYETGISSLAVTALVFSVLFLGEIMKVKRQPGIQSELMSKFVDFRSILRRKLTEGISHTPEHVVVGIILGFVVSSVVYAF